MRDDQASGGAATRPPAGADARTATEPTQGSAEVVRVFLRDAVDDDLGFIVDGWMQSFHASRFAFPMLFRNYRPWQRFVVNRLFQRPRCRAKVAVLEGYDLLVGFAVWEESTPPLLHYVYVKQRYRQRGIARALCAHLGDAFTFTHRTPIVESAYMRRRDRLTYNPFLAFFHAEDLPPR